MNENGWKFAFCKISSKFIKDNNEIRISQIWTNFVNKMCQIRCERKYPMSLRNFLTIFHLNHSSSIPFEISAAWPLVCFTGVPDTLLPISYAVLRSNELWFTFWSWNRTTFLSDPLGWKKVYQMVKQKETSNHVLIRQRGLYFLPSIGEIFGSLPFFLAILLLAMRLWWERVL